MLEPHQPLRSNLIVAGGGCKHGLGGVSMRGNRIYAGWAIAVMLLIAGCVAPPAPASSDRTPISAPQANMYSQRIDMESAEGPTPAQLELLATLQNRGAAPELQNDTWINSEPLLLADLRGSVVIVEFWTYG